MKTTPLSKIPSFFSRVIPWKQIGFLAILFPILAASKCFAASAYWPAYRGDSARQGVGAASVPQGFGIQWSFTTIGQVFAAPVVDAQENLYFGDVSGNFYEVDRNGTQVFRQKGLVKITGSAALDPAGNLYVGSWDGHLYGLSPNGSTTWSYKTNGAIESSPLVDGNTVYTTSSDGSLYALTTAGVLKWSYATADSIFSSPALRSDHVVVLASSDHQVYAVSPNGTLLWTFPGRESFVTTPAIGADNSAYVGCLDTYLYAISPTGTLRWSAAPGGVIFSSAAVTSNAVYFGSDSNEVFAYDLQGVLQWSYGTSAVVRSSPIVDGSGDILVGSYDQNFYRLSADGLLREKAPMENLVVSEAAQGPSGKLYLGLGTGAMSALGFSTPTPVPATPSPTPTNPPAPPVILGAGFLNTYLQAEIPGVWGLSVLVFYEGPGFPQLSLDIPLESREGSVFLFGFANTAVEVPIAERLMGSLYASSPDGQLSSPWPYLTVN